MAPLLEVEGLTVVHESRLSRTILDGVDLRIDDGQTLGIVGESGSGKSVLLTAILGLLAPPWCITAGSVRLEDRELLGLGERALGLIRGKELGLALANPRQHLNPILPVGRQIANVLRVHGPLSRTDALAKAADLLRSVGIPDPVSRLQAYPHELSGGMCQRVILALAIANAPRLLMVDEPTSGLDVTISVQILDLLQSSVRELRSGLIVVSRDLGVVAHYCERVAVMQAGRIVEEAPVRTFFAAPRDAYSRRLLQAAAAARDTDLVAEAGSGGGAFATAAPSAPVLELDGLVKRFPVKGGRTLTAVNDVSLTIARGESVALVGESGSGKTTVGRCILRLIEPTAGTVRYLGRDVSLLPQGQFRRLRSRIQMVFQDPFDSMDPRQRVEAALEEPLRLTATMSAADRRQRVAELPRLVGLDASAAGLYPHQMSAGALQRVGIARAVATEPDLIVFDEPTSALDVSVRAEILNLLRDLQRRLGMAYLFISHDLTAVRRLCHRTAILYLGQLVEIGETEALFANPLHPYSRALLSSVLYPDPAQVRSPFALTGEIPSPIDLPTGCPLHTRCPMATAHCSTVVPPLERKAPGHWLACLNVPVMAPAAARPQFGGRIVGTRAEIAIAEHAALDLAARHAREADAVLIGVSFDVGLRALRELLPIPVAGMTEAACLTACMLGGRFGLVTYGRRNAATFCEIVAGYGLADRLAGIRAPDLTPAEMLTDPEGTAAAIAEAARDLANTDNAEVVVLAGATMAGLPFLIQPLVPVPLVEGIASGVGLAEMLARLHPAGAIGGSYARVGGRQSTGLSAELSRMLGGA